MHYILPNKNGRNIKKLIANRYGSDKIEWEANRFAAAFLMPAESFSDLYLNKHNKNLYLVAKEFGVSYSAAKIRAEILSL